MNYPLVTIGVTCFNAQETIARAITSALEQDWPNIEIVIVDDVSTDGSVAAVNAIIVSDRRARLVIHDANTGPAGARNTILEEATGELVVFFDDDDESFPGRVREQVRVLTNFEEQTGATLVACYASGARRYPNGYLKSLPAIGSKGAAVPNGPAVADYLLIYRRKPGWFFGSGTPSCSLMARRSTFDEAGGFDANLRRVEDTDFAIRLALLGGHFIGTSEQLFVQYATNAADKSPERNVEAEQRLAQKNEAYLRSIRRYYYARHWPMLRYWHFKRRYGRFGAELFGLALRNPVAVLGHLLETGPKRMWHERRMREPRVPSP